MNALLGRFILFYSFALLATSCLKPYDPPVIKDTPEYLVVDAFADPEKGTAKVTLSYTESLSSSTTQVFEPGAAITLEDEEGNSYLLTEQEEGRYMQSGLILDLQKRYRIHIQTTGNKEYASDYVELKQTPPIDSVSWVLDNGVEIRVSTHDNTGNSRYYRWNYVETWEYRSKFELTNRLVDGKFIATTPEDAKHVCWRSQHSTSVLIKGTNKQSDDIVRNFALTFIPKGSIKISVKYSILVLQEVLTEDAYNYWLNLQKITENLGGLFDPQPSQITGNIRCISHPEELVIGYFNGAAVVQKRIFIPYSDLPSSITNFNYPFCPEDTILFSNPSNPTGSSEYVTGIYSLTGQSPPVIGYFETTGTCIDCELFGGGVSVRPDFWE